MLKMKNSQAGLGTLANNAVATTNNASQQQGTTETKIEPIKLLNKVNTKPRSNHSCSWF